MARSISVTITITPEMKDALEAIAKNPGAEGERWSVNREIWERLKYTFDLTGLGGDIEPHAKRLVTDRVRRATGRLLEEKAFELAGVPRFRSTRALGDDDVARPTLSSSNAFAAHVEGPAEKYTHPMLTDDFLSLRDDYQKALYDLVFVTDANLSEAQFASIDGIWKSTARSELFRIADALTDRLGSLAEASDTALIEAERVTVRADNELVALQECLTCEALHRFAETWIHLRDDAVSRLISRSQNQHLPRPIDGEKIHQKLGRDLALLYKSFQNEIVENMNCFVKILEALNVVLTKESSALKSAIQAQAGDSNDED